MDHIKTGGTLLNMKFTPALLEGDGGIDNLHSLVRCVLQARRPPHAVQRGHAPTLLREAKADPGAHRDLIVRVAGYSDYFCDLSEALQDEIIRRTEHTRVLGAGHQGVSGVAARDPPVSWGHPGAIAAPEPWRGDA